MITLDPYGLNRVENTQLVTPNPIAPLQFPDNIPAKVNPDLNFIENFINDYFTVSSQDQRDDLIEDITLHISELTSDVQFDFSKVTSKSDLVEKYLTPLFLTRNAALRSFAEAVWYKNSYQLSPKECVRIGCKIINTVLPLNTLQALKVWNGFAKKATHENADTLNSIFTAIFNLDINSQLNFTAAIRRCLRKTKFLPENRHLEKILILFNKIGFYEDAYKLIVSRFQDPFNKAVIHCIKNYLAQLAQAGSSSFVLRANILQKNNCEDLQNEFAELTKEVDKEYRLSEQGWTIEQIENFIKTGLQSSAEKASQHYMILLQNKIAEERFSEAFELLDKEWNALVNIDNFEKTYRELFIPAIQKKKCDTIKLSNSFYEKSKKFIKLHWQILEKAFETKSNPLEWNKQVNLLIILCQPLWIHSKQEIQLSVLGSLVNTAVKFQSNGSIKIVPLLKFILEIGMPTECHVKIQEKYWELLAKLLNVSCARSKKSEETDLIKQCIQAHCESISEKVTELFNVPLQFQVFQALFPWIDKLKWQQLIFTFIYEIVTCEASSSAEQLLVIHSWLIPEEFIKAFYEKLQSCSILEESIKNFYEELQEPYFDDDLYFINILIIRFLDRQLNHPALAWARLMCNCIAGKVINDRLFETLFRCCRVAFHSNKREFDYLLSHIKQICKPHKDNEYHQKLWIDLAQFFKNYSEYPTCLRCIQEVEVPKTKELKKEIKEIAQSCLTIKGITKFQRELGIFLAMFLRFPNPSPLFLHELFLLVDSFHDVKPKDKKELWNLLKAAEEKKFFKNNPSEQLDCWKLALTYLKEENEIFNLLAKDSLLFNTFPATHDPQILSDLYLLLIKASCPFIKHTDEGKLKKITRIYNQMYLFVKQQFDPLYCPESYYQKMMQWFYRFLYPAETDPKLLAIRNNFHEVNTLLLDTLHTGSAPKFQIDVFGLSLFEVNRMRRQYAGNPAVELDPKLTKRVIQLLERYLNLPDENYIIFHAKVFNLIYGLYTLPLTIANQFAILNICMEHSDRSPYIVIEALRILNVLVESYNKDMLNPFEKTKLKTAIKECSREYSQYTIYKSTVSKNRLFLNLEYSNLFSPWELDEMRASIDSSAFTHPWIQKLNFNDWRGVM